MVVSFIAQTIVYASILDMLEMAGFRVA